MGRTPAPTSLKLVKGTRKDRVNSAEPIIEGVVVPPAWLNDAALEVWREFAPRLERAGVLRPTDVEDFAIWCEARVRFVTASKALDVEGEVVQSPVFDRHGTLSGHRQARNQWVFVWKDAAEVMLRRGAKFGMTPSDRSQLKVDDAGKPAGGNSTADLLSG